MALHSIVLLLCVLFGVVAPAFGIVSAGFHHHIKFAYTLVQKKNFKATSHELLVLTLQSTEAEETEAFNSLDVDIATWAWSPGLKAVLHGQL